MACILLPVADCPFRVWGRGMLLEFFPGGYMLSISNITPPIKYTLPFELSFSFFFSSLFFLFQSSSWNITTLGLIINSLAILWLPLVLGRSRVASHYGIFWPSFLDNHVVTLETSRKLGRVNFRKDFWRFYWGTGKQIGRYLNGASNYPRSLCEC